MTDLFRQTWEYRPSQSRQVVAEDGTTICRIHRGKKAQRVGPLLAAAPKLLATLEACAEALPLGEAYDAAQAAIAEAKGETNAG